MVADGVVGLIGENFANSEVLPRNPQQFGHLSEIAGVPTADDGGGHNVGFNATAQMDFGPHVLDQSPIPDANR